MKCPKCGYLGFETTERCRHCGYDFSLTVPADVAADLPLRSPLEAEAALGDFDLDRIIGASAAPGPEPELPDPARPPAPAGGAQADSEAPPLPLFGRRADREDVITPPPARPPLVVRRATPEVARRRTPRTIRRASEGLELQLEPPTPATVSQPVSDVAAASAAAPRIRRIAAAVVDVMLLGAITFAVLYLTLAIAGLPLADVLALPPVPMGAFLLLLNGGYLIAFTAANGQTIGKMLFGVRVIGDASDRVDLGGAIVRAVGVMLSVVTLGLAFLPALIARDGRALHDRLAGTRVIKHA